MTVPDRGSALTAMQAREAGLAARRAAVTDADRVLAEALNTAHSATVEGSNQLEAIAAQVDDRVRTAAAVDTGLGVRELHKFLIAKQREIIAVVVAAQRDDDAARTRLQSLRPRYSDG